MTQILQQLIFDEVDIVFLAEVTANFQKKHEAGLIQS